MKKKKHFYLKKNLYLNNTFIWSFGFIYFPRELNAKMLNNIYLLDYLFAWIIWQSLTTVHTQKKRELAIILCQENHKPFRIPVQFLFFEKKNIHICFYVSLSNTLIERVFFNKKSRSLMQKLIHYILHILFLFLKIWYK